MRPRALLLALLIAASLAGCFGSDDDAPPDAPTATPTPEPTPEPTPDPTPSPTPTPTTPAPEAKVVVETSFDYSTGEAAGPDGKNETFDVPDGFQTLVLNLTARNKDVGGSPLTVTVNADLEILDPDGEAVVQSLPDGAAEVQAPAKPGTWTIRYTGTGSVVVEIVGTAT